MALPAKAFAFGAVVHYEGQVDDRVAYFADVRYLLNKTPPDQLGGGVEVREIPVTAVYEQPEEKVVALMGNPNFNQVAGTRFLRYTQYWEKAGVTVYGAQGVIGGEVGGYAECYAEFRVRQDAKGEWKVDDVLVRADYQGTGLGRYKLMCDDVLSRAKL